MTIDWAGFTPMASALGGLLIGLAAAALMLLNGRIAGISGIVGGLIKPAASGDRAWRVAFLLGLIGSPFVAALIGWWPTARIEASTSTLVVAGLLVGVGTRYAGGCTSGHGVCGLSRRSPRSVVATAVFMAAGFVTVFAVRHGLGA